VPGVAIEGLVYVARAEDLSERRAAEAVRARIHWKSPEPRPHSCESYEPIVIGGDDDDDDDDDFTLYRHERL
jgi:hypothetical protein